MAKRYELSHRQWERLKGSLPGKVTDSRRYRPAVFSSTSMPGLPGATGWLWGAVPKAASCSCLTSGCSHGDDRISRLAHVEMESGVRRKKAPRGGYETLTVEVHL